MIDHLEHRDVLLFRIDGGSFLRRFTETCNDDPTGAQWIILSSLHYLLLISRWLSEAFIMTPVWLKYINK